MALTLTRTGGEWLQIGEAMVLVSRIRGNRVRLTIDAPDDVEILRGELIERKEDDSNERPAA